MPPVQVWYCFNTLQRRKGRASGLVTRRKRKESRTKSLALSSAAERQAVRARQRWAGAASCPCRHRGFAALASDAGPAAWEATSAGQ